MNSNLGILLTNLGTPDRAEAGAIRRYLREFLWDRHVVDVPRILWAPILYAFILPFRPLRIAKNYKKIWLPEGSPLLVHSRQQAELLQLALRRKTDESVHVVLGMRYGNPSIRQALNTLQEKNCQKVLLFPLFPQFSHSTTTSTVSRFSDVLGQLSWSPDTTHVRDYHDHPAYVEALAQSVERYWQAHGNADRLMLSYHGIPKRYEDRGDPYGEQCRQTSRLVAARLSLAESQYLTTFQSRFGREEWLRPYTDATLKEWAAAGFSNVDVICPGFPADCLETLEEIAVQNRRFFRVAGGQRFRYIPALNDEPIHIEALAQIAYDNL